LLSWEETSSYWCVFLVISKDITFEAGGQGLCTGVGSRIF